MRELVPYSDVVIANEEDIQKCLGIAADSDVTSGELNTEIYKTLAQKSKRSISKCISCCYNFKRKQKCR